MAVDYCARLAANIHSTAQSVIGRVLMIRRRHVLTRRTQKFSMQTRSTATENDERGQCNGSVRRFRSEVRLPLDTATLSSQYRQEKTL